MTTGSALFECASAGSRTVTASGWAVTMLGHAALLTSARKVTAHSGANTIKVFLKQFMLSKASWPRTPVHSIFPDREFEPAHVGCYGRGEAPDFSYNSISTMLNVPLPWRSSPVEAFGG